MSVFLLSCGSPEFRFPDDWMTTERRANDRVVDSHIRKWWSSTCPRLVKGGDIAVLVATGSGKVMGAFQVLGEATQDGSHPLNPEKWPWTVALRPLVLLDGELAPLLWQFDLQAPRKYSTVDANKAP